MKGNPWIQRVAGIIAAYVVTFASSRGLTLDTEQTTTLFVVVFTAVEFFVAKVYNPGDAVSSHLAAKESAEVQQMKDQEKE